MKRHHTCDAAADRDCQLPSPRTDKAKQRANCIGPAHLCRILREIAHHGAGVFNGGRVGGGNIQQRQRGVRGAVLAKLRPHQRAIRAISHDQRGVAAALRHGTVLQHQNAVGVDYAGQAMRQDQRGAAGHQPLQCLLDHRLVLGVDGRQCFVQHQNWRIAQQGAGDRDALTLAAGQSCATLTDHCMVAIRQRIR